MKYSLVILTILYMAVGLLTGCSSRGIADVPAGRDAAAEAPPPVRVEKEEDVSVLKVDHPEQFQITAAKERETLPELKVTGVIAADVSRTVPVISLTSGRVIDIQARIGDSVRKDQPLIKVQSAEVAQGFSDMRQAEADETLARSQLERSKALYEKGAIARKDLEVAEGAETKAKVTVETAEEHLRLLGADPNRPGPVIEIKAPASGVITEQNVTASAGVKTLDNSPNLFTIADTSRVWVLCDVYENDLPFVRLGDVADIHPNAYPNILIKGRVTNIGAVLDPTLRTTKVRIEISNPGMLRFGMFVSATFYGQSKERRTVVPATAILHLHDRDWVFRPDPGQGFRRVEVSGGSMLPNGEQEVISGLQPGDQVVTSALVLQNEAKQ